MLVKCRVCGTKVDKKDTYCHIKYGHNLYFCSEEHKDSFVKEENEKSVKKEAKDRMTKIVYQVLGVDSFSNSILHNGLAKIAEKYSYDKITEYLESNFDYLHHVMTTKDFNSTFALAKYFLAIVKNNLEDIKYKTPREEVVAPIEEEVIETKFKRSKRRKSLAEIESEV